MAQKIRFKERRSNLDKDINTPQVKYFEQQNYSNNVEPLERPKRNVKVEVINGKKYYVF